MDEQIVVGENTQYPLQGTLLTPRDASAEHPVPAVVLVQGSGSSDRDETVYANKPFRDIAVGLQERDIATIRYDKRTFVYGRKMVKALGPDLTVEQETIEDAILAAELIRQDPRIDSECVFLLGHSQGGMLAPRIDAEGGDFAGLIIMAGTPRLLREVLLTQSADMMRDSGRIMRCIAKRQLKKLGPKLAAIPTMSDEEARRTKLFGGVYGSYLKDMEEHPAAEYLLALKKPVLIMQGERDQQISIEHDFDAYRTLCEGMPNVEFKLYAGLNHLFMTATVDSIKDIKKDYKKASFMDKQVLEDIAAWVHGHSILKDLQGGNDTAA